MRRYVFVGAVLHLAAPALAFADPPRGATASSPSPESVPSGHAIVVFGAAVGADGAPGPHLRSRLELALDHARRDPSARVVVSGGAVHNAHNEGQVMAAWLTARGVEPSRIVVDPLARHTGDNGDNVAALLRGSGVRRITLVTSRFHMARSRFHLRAALRTNGLGRVRIARAAAPDGFRAMARARTSLGEYRKIARDARYRARQGTLGLPRWTAVRPRVSSSDRSLARRPGATLGR